ncbi:hypothetical protein MRY87_04175 [bacterium]|nr:hypothetical protein [bacterium]
MSQETESFRWFWILSSIIAALILLAFVGALYLLLTAKECQRPIPIIIEDTSATVAQLSTGESPFSLLRTPQIR